MKKIYYPTMVLLMSVIVSEKVMAQSPKLTPYKSVFDSWKADKILAQEIKKKGLLQTPSLLNLKQVNTTPIPTEEKSKNWSISLP